MHGKIFTSISFSDFKSGNCIYYLLEKLKINWTNSRVILKSWKCCYIKCDKNLTKALRLIRSSVLKKKMVKLTTCVIEQGWKMTAYVTSSRGRDWGWMRKILFFTWDEANFTMINCNLSLKTIQESDRCAKYFLNTMVSFLGPFLERSETSADKNPFISSHVSSFENIGSDFAFPHIWNVLKEQFLTASGS